MSFDSTVRRAGLCFTLAGCTLFTLTTGIANADSKIYVFPNPNVPYQIPLDEPPKKQAEHLFGALEKHNYSQLEKQLRRYVPELRKIDKEDIEPLDDIVTLAVTATNPEVREAFDLMIKGGRIGWSPNYQLIALFSLAKINDFNKNDTLSLCLSIDYGIYFQKGTSATKDEAIMDLNDLVNYFRSINRWRKEKWGYGFESSTLDELICLGWNGDYSPFNERDFGLMRHNKITLEIYKWNTIDASTLEQAQQVAKSTGFIRESVDETIAAIERYFFFDRSPYWDTVPTEIPEKHTIVDGKRVINHDMNNPTFTFQYFVKNGKTFGDCGDQTNLVNLFAKACGIATNITGNQKFIGGQCISHFYTIYLDPSAKLWKAYHDQLDVNRSLKTSGIPFYNHTLKPPIRLSGYSKRRLRENIPLGNSKHTQKLTLDQVKDMFGNGISGKMMKKWLMT